MSFFGFLNVFIFRSDGKSGPLCKWSIDADLAVALSLLGVSTATGKVPPSMLKDTDQDGTLSSGALDIGVAKADIDVASRAMTKSNASILRGLQWPGPGFPLLKTPIWR